MINSRAKGARGERQWRDFLRESGFDARRGQQFCGSPDSPDVVCKALPFHFEVKCVQALNIDKAMLQAIKDSSGRPPVVAHRKDHCDWMITMKAQDWMELVKMALPPNV